MEFLQSFRLLNLQLKICFNRPLLKFFFKQPTFYLCSTSFAPSPLSPSHKGSLNALATLIWQVCGGHSKGKGWGHQRDQVREFYSSQTILFPLSPGEGSQFSHQRPVLHLRQLQGVLRHQVAPPQAGQEPLLWLLDQGRLQRLFLQAGTRWRSTQSW